jgi:hypothetical protein
MDRQVVFNKVRDHLLAQGKKSYGEHVGFYHVRCAYRGDNGMKCAIGCLIPDDKYKRTFEGHALASRLYADMSARDAIIEILAEEFGGVCDDDKAFLEALQSIHDNSWAYDWAKRLNECAVKHNLRP